MNHKQKFNASIQCPCLGGMLLAITLAGSAMAQDANSQLNPAPDGALGGWFARASKIQSGQPHWITPITTVTPRLEEELRYDQSFETTASGTRLDNYGSGKRIGIDPRRKHRSHPRHSSLANPKQGQRAGRFRG
ncbi:MAG TPA: hypothetical protein VGO59_17910 [Verrucomicrobiae bacterium]|jgi:hypothetical protein